MATKNNSLVAKTLAALAAASVITSGLTAFAGHGSSHSGGHSQSHTSGHAGNHHASSSHSSTSHQVSHSNGSTHNNRPSKVTSTKSKSLGKTASTSVSKKGKTIGVSVTKKVAGSTSKSAKLSPAKMTKHHHHPHHHHHHWHHGWTYPYPHGDVVIEGEGVAPLYTAEVVGDATDPIDLELLGVEQIDDGDASNGPSYRVTFRNNSAVDVPQAFDVAVIASNDGQPSDDAPQAASRVEGIQANQVLTVDVRLPLEAGGMSYLTAVVNSTEEVQEATLDNNFATLDSSDIAMVAN
jgi:hypothetical protein